ncbi:glycoside hydrolase family 2 TIM barrel-domain containing protein [Hymenobacter seoulensis]
MQKPTLLLSGICKRLIRNALLSVLTIYLAVGCNPREEPESQSPPEGVVPVKLVHTPQGYQLLRGGKPYFIKGGAGLQRYDQLKAVGGNSVRLWSADYADDRMAEAHRQGLTVMLGLWMEHESKHFDYYNKEQVAQQKEKLRQQVLKYRYHPALLAWDVGNEIDLESTNPSMYRALNDLARMIHELDPYHPVTTTLTSTVGNLKYIKRLCPDVDFISINAFGNLTGLQQRLQAKAWTGPYAVTEFGARGYWESRKTGWKAAFEQSSTEKASFTRERYTQAVLSNPATCLGAYVFFWGNKYEYTSTWFSLFSPTGEKTETVDVMQELWSEKAPGNLAPRISGLLFAEASVRNGRRLVRNSEHEAMVLVSDPENDSLTVVWEVFPDMRQNTAPDVVQNSVQASGVQAVIKAPQQPGPYRLAVTVSDGKGSIATANVPFYVQ